MEQTVRNPLRAIFEGEYKPETGYHPMTKEEDAVWEKAQAILGSQIINELLYNQCRSLAEEQYDYFRAGFRLGAQLMLELK